MATYFEKLKDPRWQKKRLEALEKSGWACDQCCDKDSTLHVHHRQYFKGREPLEYELGQLEVLCEECHHIEHESEDKLLLAASFVVSEGPFNRDSAASLIAGFCRQGMGQPYVDDPDSYVAGEVAFELSDMGLILDLIKLTAAIKARDKFTVREALTAFIEDLNTRPTAIPPELPEGFEPL